MDGAAKTRKNNVAGQISLFGDLLGDAGLDVPPPPLPDISEYPPRALLAMEKEMTGVYITGHPLDEYREPLSRMEVNAQFLSTLSEEREDHGLSMDGLSAVMAGIITEKKTKSTRKGDMMAFITLEDLYGSTEILIFPKTYEKYRHLLEPDTLVSIYGHLSVREDDPTKLLADAILPLSPETLSMDSFKNEVRPRRPRQQGTGWQAPLNESPYGDMNELPPPVDYADVVAPRPASIPTHRAPENKVSFEPKPKKLYLKVSDETQRDQCLPVLQKTPGSIPVTFYVTSLNAAFRADGHSVSANVDMKSLAALLGEKNVVMK